jgi:hypothetical protein
MGKIVLGHAWLIMYALPRDGKVRSFLRNDLVFRLTMPSGWFFSSPGGVISVLVGLIAMIG